MRVSPFLLLVASAVGSVFGVYHQAQAQVKNNLSDCYTKMVIPLQDRWLSVNFTERRLELQEREDPWRPMTYSVKGKLWLNAEQFMKHDSLQSGHRHHVSKTMFSPQVLLHQDYSARSLSPVTEKNFEEYILQTARYTPAHIISFFKQRQANPDPAGNTYYSMYKDVINNTRVALYVRNADAMPYQVVITGYDMMLGDVQQTIAYDSFMVKEGVSFPTRVSIQKYNARFTDVITLTDATITKSPTPLLTKPSNYRYQDTVLPSPKVTLNKLTANITLLTLVHTNSISAVIEFNDFLAVLNAPNNTKNGELILQEAKKIAPKKPVRYFVAGNHHPLYMGGVRAFIAEGSRIVSTDQNKAYIRFLAEAPHSLQADALHLHPKPLLMDSISGNKMVIKDKTNQMVLYVMGAQSKRSTDYLLAYFPSDKLLIQNDLTYIPLKGTTVKANARQLALYQFIRANKLDVETIVQCNEAESKVVKSIIQMSELEESIK